MNKNFVHSIFSSVAHKYDLMNNLMSFGAHHLWKSEMLKEINSEGNFNVVDVAGGTGDIASCILHKFREASVTICDSNFDMIEQGVIKATNKGNIAVKWVCGDGERLPLSDNSYDYYTISFGIRNIQNIDFALEEAFRVLKPGGKFICLEFSHIENNSWFAKAYELYSSYIIPYIGKLVAGDQAAYQYLVDSIRAFPTQKHFSRLISAAGFSNVSFRNLSCGITAIHTAWKAE